MTPVIYKPRETDFTHNGLGRLSEATRCDITEEANGKFELELDYPATSRFSEYFENGYQIKAKPNDLEEYHIFEIKQTFKDTFLGIVTVYAQCRTYKLGNREVQYVDIKSADGAKAMKAIEANMDEPCDVKLFSDISANSNTVFEARNVLNCIAGEQGSLLQLWGGEIKREPFKLSLLKRRGRDNVGTVRYGKDLNGLKIKFDWSSIVTKVLPFADLQDGNDGKTKRIYGDPVKSQYMNNYPDIYARHIQFTEEQGVTDKASLNRVAKNYFTSMNPGSDKPKVSMELEVEKLTDSEEAKEFSKIRNYGLFDTFKIYHNLYDIDIDTKVNSIIYDSLLEKNKKVIAGDIQVAFYKQQNYEFQEAMKTLTKKGYMSEFVDYITDLINGVQGGSVLQYPKNHPHTTYYMDTDSTDTAKNVIAINNAGIGFSTTGWRGPFTNAWTIDGILNADFIRAGKIRADIFETSFNAYGDQLKLSGGALQAVNNKKKIMELDKQGMKFWKNTEPIGAMGTAGGKMGGFAWPEDYEGKFINISLADDGKAIQLITKQPSDPKKGAFGIAITHEGKIHIVGDEISITANDKLFLGGGKGISVTSSMDVLGKLTVKGQEIGDGSGGGGGGIGGGYPPEVTSKADKFAWDLWAYLLSKGYSKAAAAGILGNVQQETGGTMDPDTLQGGVGPGYGLVQWDGSRYPLVPPATSDGIQYVKNLMKAANITDGHASILGQSKLLDWSMYNGQWLGIVEPVSVEGFKKMTDPRAAANTFERNFERPAVAHPERQGYAQEWYNKFKDLKPSTDGWLTPVRVGYVVTQEWDQIGWGTGEIHGGIDLAPTGGGNPPIYAAKGGTVMTVGNNPALEGNYVMIDHGDSYYTYYGHMVDGSVKVTTGQKVTNSTVIGSMGATGLASGVHLHFEVRKGGSTASSRINPRDVIKF